MPRPDLPPEERPSAIPSSPTHPGVVSAAIDSVGKPTRSVQRRRSPEHLLVDGLDATFGCPVHRHAGRLVVVAGGVGTTPVMSRLRFPRAPGDNGRSATRSRGEADNLLRDAPPRRETEMPLPVIPVLSQPSPHWNGARERIAPEALGRSIEEEDAAQRAPGSAYRTATRTRKMATSAFAWRPAGWTTYWRSG